MRVVAEIPHPQLKITVFHWNAKFIIKFEAGSFEQIYKINENDLPDGLNGLKKMINDDFIKNTTERFIQMRNDFKNAYHLIN
jgi:hypothetical protein